MKIISEYKSKVCEYDNTAEQKEHKAEMERDGWTSKELTGPYLVQYAKVEGYNFWS